MIDWYTIAILALAAVSATAGYWFRMFREGD